VGELEFLNKIKNRIQSCKISSNEIQIWSLSIEVKTENKI
jgi:hypothetical protein